MILFRYHILSQDSHHIFARIHITSCQSSHHVLPGFTYNFLEIHIVFWQDSHHEGCIKYFVRICVMSHLILIHILSGFILLVSFRICITFYKHLHHMLSRLFSYPKIIVHLPIIKRLFLATCTYETKWLTMVIQCRPWKCQKMFYSASNCLDLLKDFTRN